eukprot:gene29331-51306_t
MGAPGPDLDWQGDLEAEVSRRTSLYSASDEMHDAARFDAMPADKQMTARGIEVGHIFYFGTKYSLPMKANVTGPDGKDTPVQMGSYGVGVSRLVAAIIEASHDDSGIIWPDVVAPFGAAVLNLRAGDAACDAACETAYAALTAAGKDPLYDDRDERPGAKFAATDLVGIPWQLVIGPKASGDRRAADFASGRRAEGHHRMSDAAPGLGGRARPFGLWERMLAIRYLRAKRSQGGVGLISVISFI